MSHDEREIGSLIAALIAKIKEMAETEHVGHFNRLFGQREQIYAAIAALPEGPAALAQLYEDPDPRVQLAVAQHCKYQKINVVAALDALRKLASRPDEIGRDAKSSLEPRVVETSDPPALPTPRTFPFLPAPRACDRHEAERLVTATFPARAQEVKGLLRPAIRIWPTKPAGSPTGSRLGGLPAVPPGWSWPFADEEPFVFLAQINCTELGPLAKAFNLPQTGLLNFFGDHDDINGVPMHGGAVFYFGDLGELALQQLPMAEDEPLITCDMRFYETYELPHPFSEAVGALQLPKPELDTYFNLYEAIAQFGYGERQDVSGDEISKLFGWPDLVQGEVFYGDVDRLLLQIGCYRDGTEMEGWGPGGTLYFLLPQDDLSHRRFGQAELFVQCT